MKKHPLPFNEEGMSTLGGSVVDRLLCDKQWRPI